MVPFSFAKAFLDDILIFSENIDDHSIHVEQVLIALWNNNVAIEFEKSKFFQREVTYLGHINSRFGRVKGRISTKEAMKDISTDIYGPIEARLFRGTNGNQKAYIVTIVDRCTQ